MEKHKSNVLSGLKKWKETRKNKKERSIERSDTHTHTALSIVYQYEALTSFLLKGSLFARSI